MYNHESTRENLSISTDKHTMQSHGFENKLKKIVGRNLPRGLDKIIIESGFDCESILATIDQNSIKSIEDYVNENKNILEGTVYQNQLNFRLKPGHKSFILSLPKALLEHEKKSKKNRVCYSENTEKQLKGSLLKKITNFAKKFSFTLDYNEQLIIDFQQTNESVECRLECPICFTPIKCEKKKYWLISNLERHLKKHFEHVEIVEVEGEDSPIEQLNSTHGISYVAAGQMSELDKILDE